jgi:hypothetical protein
LKNRLARISVDSGRTAAVQLPDGDGANQRAAAAQCAGNAGIQRRLRAVAMLQNPRGEVVFIMAFSGGGKRSAAFAHRVLRGLRQIPVVEEGRNAAVAR